MMDNAENGAPKEPPKIKINLADTSKLKSDSTPIQPANGNGNGNASPPKQKLRLPKDLVGQATENLSKSDTAKVATPPPPEPLFKKSDETAQKPSNGADQTMNLSLDDEDDDSKDAPAATAKAQEKQAEDSGRTMKLSMDDEEDDSQDAPAAAAKAKEKQAEESGRTMKLTLDDEEAADAAPEKEPVEDMRPKSQPIHLDDINEDSLEDLYKAALNATQRVILEDKESTSHIKPAVKDSQDIKESDTNELRKNVTARLILDEIKEEEEEESAEQAKELSETDRLSGKEPPKPTGTVKLHRPGAQVAPHAPDTDPNAKSATARIDLPPSAMSPQGTPTQRKTIRIKRPTPGGGGSGAPRLTVSRPTSDKKSVPAVAGASKKAVKLDSDEFDVHPAFTAMAIVAVLISLAVVYVLAATLVQGIPFPGRLV